MRPAMPDSAIARIDRLQRRAADTPSVIPLGGGLPSEEQFPRQALAAAFLRAVSQPGAPALQYGWPEGSPKLREIIAARLCARGAQVTPDDVLVTNGAQQALALASALLCPRGSRIGVDPESYPAALDLFRDRNLTLTSDWLSARAIYVMPGISNPRGATSSAEERRRLLELRRPVIEDDAYAELAFAGPPAAPLLALARERVLHVGTFSKTLCPGLRVGWLVPPTRLRRRALRLKQDADLQPSSLGQTVIEQYLAHTDFEHRLVRLRRFYRRRAHLLCAALRRHLPGWRFEPPAGGFSVWVEIDAPADEVALLETAIETGVVFDPGLLFRAARGGRPRGEAAQLRLTYASAKGAQLEEGIRRLALAWRKYQQGSTRSRTLSRRRAA